MFQLRDWATSLGAWFPLAFLGAHIVVTVFPFPRTAFTLAAGSHPDIAVADDGRVHGHTEHHVRE